MEALTHQSLEQFREAALPLLTADPVRHTIVLTALERKHPDTLLITLHDNGNVAGAVLQVPPYPLLVSPMPAEAAGVTAKAVFAARPQLSSASGPAETVDAFVTAWTQLTGTKADQDFGLRLFELDELTPPAIAGTARQGTEDDLTLLARWRELFSQETLHRAFTPQQALEEAQHSLTPGNINFFWELDGEPVAFVGARGPFAGMARVAPVYTRPEHRGHGYASAATAVASQWALDQGAEHVLLFTDLANEITNRIYPRLGYRAVADFAEYSFT